MYTRCIVKQTLLEKECEIEFKKINGDIRKMRCTLKPDLLPKNNSNEENKRKKKENLEILSVYDLDKKEWRSFKISNIISLKEL
jgi:hypothetical protein